MNRFLLPNYIGMFCMKIISCTYKNLHTIWDMTIGSDAFYLVQNYHFLKKLNNYVNVLDNRLIFMMFFGLLLFKVMQLFVSYFILRMIYTVLFIMTFIYCMWQGYQNATYMVHGDKKQRSALVEWFSRNSKPVLIVLGIIGSAYFIIKAVFEPAANMERRIIGSMADFLPLLLVLANFAYIYYIGVVTRSYYVYKYSEIFRLKFGYDIQDWYGPKYTQK